MESFLDDLFLHLKSAETEEEISNLQDQIWQIWLHTGDSNLDYLFSQGNKAIERHDLKSAIDFFTQIIETQPDLPEGWNKRATAYFLRGNLKAAINDIEETLKREPRHFGALSGLAAIYMTIGDLVRALKTSERLLALIPRDDSTQAQVAELRQRLGLDSQT